jgi:YVTN family beta-propeller protein
MADEPSQSSLMVADSTGGEPVMMMAAVANSAPTVAPVVGSPDQATGAVQVSLNATDVEGNPLTYAVTSQPTGGSVVASSNGVFTYTPSVASRLAAATTSTPDFDSFTVSVSDGQGGVTPVTVSVPKLPAVWASQPSSSNVTGASPAGVAMVGDLVYVANQGSNTVTVINTKTGAVVGNPIVVGSAPTGVLANSDGSKVFVSNRTSGTVSVIRTSDNTVIGSVKVGTHPEQMALNSTGTRLYVTNYGSGNVSVVDVSGQTPSLITNIAVGAYPRGIAFATVNGQPRIYVTRYSSSSVAVIDANTNKQIDVNPSTSTVDSIKVGANPQSITISKDGTRAYVTNYGSSSVSVINTATNTLDGSSISVGSKPASLALSADGSLLYVANGNDTISVIDTKTRVRVVTLQIDSKPETNYHTLAVRSDGSLIATDMYDKALRVVTLNRGNTTPVALANPSVGEANPSTGAISGSVNIKDWDGDPLTYTVVSAPSKGSVTFDPAAGTYTYTPTQAARDAAAQTPATDTFTIRVADSFGAYKDTTPVTVTVSPTPSAQAIPVTSLTPIHVGDSPIGLTTSGNRLYVVNSGANTMSIIDTTNNSVLGTIPVTANPSAVAATADGQRVYVGYYNTVSAIDIDTTTNQVTGVTNITIPDLCETGECYGTAGELADVVVSPDGRYVYVARRYYFDNGSPTALSVIDPISKTVTSTGMTYSVVDMDFATDGTTRIYMADGGYHAVLMQDVATGEFADIWFTTDKGTSQVAQTVSVNPAGTRAYAVVADHLWDAGGNTVVVIDTDRTSPSYNTQIATITVPAGARYVDFSADNTRAYVVHNGGNSVTVIDTATNTVIGSITSDQIGGDYAALSVGPNGTLYFTNYSNDTVYAATVGSGASSQPSQFRSMTDVGRC